jgi:hypothetical protein
MQSLRLFGKLGIITFMLAFGALARGQNTLEFPDFSATQVFPSSKADMSMKVFRSGSSVRVERSAALSTLYVPSSSKVYNLTTYPDNSHQCVLMKPDQARMLPSPLELLEGPVVKRTPVGTEAVDGHPCQVENVVVTRPDGKTVESKVWEAEDLKGIPLRIESRISGVTLTAVYRDVSIKSPDQALFAIPEKCTPFENMGQVAERVTVK